jgi:hypothetical protein
VRGEEGGETGGGCFFIFLREEGLRLRKRNEFRFFFFFLSLGFFVFGSPFLKKLPPCEYFSPPVHMDVSSLIYKISTRTI